MYTDIKSTKEYGLIKSYIFKNFVDAELSIGFSLYLPRFSKKLKNSIKFE